MGSSVSCAKPHLLIPKGFLPQSQVILTQWCLSVTFQTVLPRKRGNLADCTGEVCMMIRRLYFPGCICSLDLPFTPVLAVKCNRPWHEGALFQVQGGEVGKGTECVAFIARPHELMSGGRGHYYC